MLTGIGIVWYMLKIIIGIHYYHQKWDTKNSVRTKLNRDKTHQNWDRLVRLEKQNRNTLST